MTEKLNVITICGSLRKASYNRALARALPRFAPADMLITEGPSIGEIPLFNQDMLDTGIPAPVAVLTNAIRAADGLIIVSPEYNWSIPGPLKNAIDWVSHVADQPFQAKPVVLQSAANGLLGGSRMQYHLRQALIGIGALILARPEIFVTFAAKKFDEKTLSLTDAPTIDLIRQQLSNYDKFVRKIVGKV